MAYYNVCINIINRRKSMNKRICAAIMASCAFAWSCFPLKAESPSDCTKVKNYVVDFVKKNKNIIITSSVGAGICTALAGAAYISKKNANIRMDFSSVKNDYLLNEFENDFIDNLEKFKNVLVVDSIDLNGIRAVFSRASFVLGARAGRTYDINLLNIETELDEFLNNIGDKNFSKNSKFKLTFTKEFNRNIGNQIQIQFEENQQEVDIDDNQKNFVAGPNLESFESNDELKNLLKEAILFSIKSSSCEKSHETESQKNEMINKLYTATEKLKDEVISELATYMILNFRDHNDTNDLQKSDLIELIRNKTDETIKKDMEEKIPEILKDFENLEKPDGQPPEDMVDNFSELVVGEMIKNICNAVENIE